MFSERGNLALSVLFVIFYQLINMVTLDAIHRDIEDLRKEVEYIKKILVPEEKISEQERLEIRKVIADMEHGSETKLENIFKD